MISFVVLHFPGDPLSLAPFHISGGHMYIFFGEISFQVLCPFFNHDIWDFLQSICRSLLYILDITLYQIMVCKYVLPFHIAISFF